MRTGGDDGGMAFASNLREAVIFFEPVKEVNHGR
jgi:hypothetical protein